MKISYPRTHLLLWQGFLSNDQIKADHGVLYILLFIDVLYWDTYGMDRRWCR